LITKTDMVDDERIHEMNEHFKKQVTKVEVVSVLDDDSVKSLSDTLVKFVAEVEKEEAKKLEEAE